MEHEAAELNSHNPVEVSFLQAWRMGVDLFDVISLYFIAIEECHAPLFSILLKTASWMSLLKDLFLALIIGHELSSLSFRMLVDVPFCDETANLGFGINSHSPIIELHTQIFFVYTDTAARVEQLDLSRHLILDVNQGVHYSMHDYEELSCIRGCHSFTE